MHETLTTLLQTYGYAVVFVLVALESLGIPLPGETVLVTGAAFAASGRLSIYGVVVTATVAAILGDNGGYWIGRKGGLRLVRRYGHHLRIRESHLLRAQEFFRVHGAKTVFIGRFIALLRTWAAVLAGAANMRYGTFMAYNALGGITWAVAFGTLGYLFGRNLPRLEHYIGQATVAVVLLAALLAAMALATGWFRSNSAHLAELLSRYRDQLASSAAVQRFRARHPRLWVFLAARFAAGEYLGLHLTIGLLLSIGALWLFGGITEDVIHHDPLTQFDLTVLDWLHRHTSSAGLSAFHAISWLGSPLVLGTEAVLVAILLAARQRWLMLGAWGAALGGASVLNSILKAIIHRPRPVYAAAYLHTYTYSFPSGHAMGSLIGYGMLAYLLIVLWTERRSTRLGVIAVTAVLVLAIGMSRLYLGVHYFSDVVGGFAAGVVWLSACVSGLEIARRQRNRNSHAR